MGERLSVLGRKKLPALWFAERTLPNTDLAECPDDRAEITIA
jgi:hypothetical protein